VNTRTPRRRPPRPLCLPPAVGFGGSFVVPVTRILEELPGEAGRALWLLIRDILLWSATERKLRDRLFTGSATAAISDAPHPAPIRSAVQTLCAMLLEESEERGTLACREISRWAREVAPRTSLLFAYAAAGLDPTSAALAREVARAAVRAGEPAMAESWARRSMTAARRNRERVAYVLALTALGEIALARGEEERARDVLERACRFAGRHSLPPAIRARVLVGLLRLALSGAGGDPEALLRQLLSTSGRSGVPGLRPRLAAARALLDAGDGLEALTVLRTRLVRAARGAERLPIYRLRARAAAHAGVSGVLERAWREAVAMLRASLSPTAADAAVAQLAREILEGLPGERRRAAEDAIRSASTAESPSHLNPSRDDRP
jgi:hypothetical protein